MLFILHQRAIYFCCMFYLSIVGDGIIIIDSFLSFRNSIIVFIFSDTSSKMFEFHLPALQKETICENIF